MDNFLISIDLNEPSGTCETLVKVEDEQTIEVEQPREDNMSVLEHFTNDWCVNHLKSFTSTSHVFSKVTLELTVKP